MSSLTLRFSGVTAESADGVRSDLTIWLSPTALTEWAGTPVVAFEIPRSHLRGAYLVEQPRKATGQVALVGTLHGRFARWLIPTPSDGDLTRLRGWVDALGVAR